MFNLTLKDYITIGVMGAVIFAAAFLLGSGIILATGIPATGGIANILIAVLLVTVVSNIIPKFGAVTITLAITFLLAIPTIIGGPPTPFKIFNGLLIGLTYDAALFFIGRSILGYTIAGSLGAITSIVSIYVLMVILNLPGVAKLQPILPYLIIVQLITGAIGAYLGVKIYGSRLSKLSVVKNLQN